MPHIECTYITITSPQLTWLPLSIVSCYLGAANSVFYPSSYTDYCCITNPSRYFRPQSLSPMTRWTLAEKSPSDSDPKRREVKRGIARVTRRSQGEEEGRMIQMSRRGRIFLLSSRGRGSWRGLLPPLWLTATTTTTTIPLPHWTWLQTKTKRQQQQQLRVAAAEAKSRLIWQRLVTAATSAVNKPAWKNCDYIFWVTPQSR